MDKKDGLFGDDDLDREIANADDTGMVREQQIINEEEVQAHLEDDEK
jgi:hypothetical protein